MEKEIEKFDRIIAEKLEADSGSAEPTDAFPKPSTRHLFIIM